MQEDEFNFKKDDPISVLTHKVMRTYYEYDIIDQFFGTSARVEFINEIPGNLFAHLQQILVDRTILNITKLLDPHKKGGNKNLTLKSLLTFDWVQKSAYYENLEKAIEDLESEIKHIKKQRSKVTAHSDYDVAIGKKKLITISYSDLRNSVQSIHDIITIFYESEYGNSWDFKDDAVSDVNSIIQTLRRGRVFEHIYMTDRNLRNKLIKFDSMLYTDL